MPHTPVADYDLKAGVSHAHTVGTTVTSQPPGREGAMRGGFWLAASNLIPMLPTLALSVVIGRVLGSEDLGQQSYIAYMTTLLWTLVVGVVATMALRVLGQAHGKADPHRIASLYQWTSIGQVGGSMLVATILLAFSAFSESRLAWQLSAATVFIDGLFSAKATSMIARRGWSTVARGRLMSQTAASFLGIAAVLLGMGIDGVFLANLAGSVALLIWLTPQERLPRILPLTPFPRDLLRVWGAFLLLGVLSQIVSSRIEFLFLGVWSTKTELAMYSIAFMTVSSALILPTSIIGAAMPAIASQEGAGRIVDASASLGSAFRVLIIVGCILTAGVASLGPALVGLAYGSRFIEGANLIPLLSLGLVASTAAALFWTFAQGSGRTWIPISSALVAAIVDLTMAFVLVKPLGATGAAMANVGAQYALLLAILLLSRRQFGRFPLRIGRLAVPVAACVAIGVVCLWLVRTIGYQTAGEAIMALCAGSLAFSVATVAFGASYGFVKGNDVDWLRTSMPSSLGRLVHLLAGRREYRGRNA